MGGCLSAGGNGSSLPYTPIHMRTCGIPLPKTSYHIGTHLNTSSDLGKVNSHSGSTKPYPILYYFHRRAHLKSLDSRPEQPGGGEALKD